jgi:hypothetical protein
MSFEISRSEGADHRHIQELFAYRDKLRTYAE